MLPKSFVEQAIGRCSVSGSKIWMNCNPNSPYHWLKQEYIDRKEEKNILRLKFQLEDNLTLPKDTINRYKRMFTGVFYKRYILGDWVMAEGLIYENFDEEKMTTYALPKMQRYWYGVDYGTSNATTFILVGQGIDHKMYVIDEYYHSNIKSGQQKSPQQYAEDLKQFIAKHNVKYEYVFIDPSAEGFIITCYQNGIQKITQAINEVKLGIGIIQSLITDTKFIVHKDCVNTLKELSSYSWDSRAQAMGIDKPMKTNDHCLDPIRYVANATRGHWYQTTKNPLIDNKGYHKL